MSQFSTIQLVEESFDDGYRPGQPTTLFRHVGKNSSKFMTVFDDVLPEEWCDYAYEFAITRMKPWGVYITTAEAMDQSIRPEDFKDKQPEHGIALQAVRSLIMQRGGPFIGPDMSELHGTAVWCLTSGLTKMVEYHIDYAELYRYENNAIHPPIYAATLHVSPFEEDEMVGGDFMANMKGLDHYKRFGYKGRESYPVPTVSFD